MATRKVVVIGGGLAGFAATIEASKFAQVVLLDKEARIGGNSAKASSGINGVNTPAQLEAHIEDSPDLFRNDTLKSGSGLCQTDLVDVLSTTSNTAIEFLSSFGVHLDAITQCGGHSRPRTHRAKPVPGGKASNIGWEIISTLNNHVTTQLKDKVQIITNAKATNLLTENGKVTGVTYTTATETVDLKADAVVLATGGYSADVKGFLEQYVPKIAHLSTTNGPWATGDGVRLAQKLGAGVTIMDKVQIHPTSFVDPSAPNASPKILAPEALRAVGGILVNQKGQRFSNELGLRDYVTKQIFEHCEKYGENGPVVSYLILNEKGVEEFGASVLGFYKSKGLIKVYANVKEAAVGMNVNEAALEKTLQDYAESAKSGSDAFGKTLYPTVFKLDEPLHVMIITPSIHYTMGGVKINAKGQVLRDDNTIIEGLYGAGEVTGGVHGENRLAGNSLLECVIFGRISGRNAAQ